MNYYTNKEVWGRAVGDVTIQSRLSIPSGFLPNPQPAFNLQVDTQKRLPEKRTEASYMRVTGRKGFPRIWCLRRELTTSSLLSVKF